MHESIAKWERTVENIGCQQRNITTLMNSTFIIENYDKFPLTTKKGTHKVF